MVEEGERRGRDGDDEEIRVGVRVGEEEERRRERRRWRSEVVEVFEEESGRRRLLC